MTEKIQLEELDQMIGKKIVAIKQDSDEKLLAIHLDTQEVVILHSDVWSENEVSVSEKITTSPYNYVQARELGLIDEPTAKLYRRKVQGLSEEKDKARRRRLYNDLKKEFGNED